MILLTFCSHMVCLLDLERNNHKIGCSLLDINRYKYLLVVPVNQMLGKVKVNALYFNILR